jgi:hypothetical protein
VDVRHARDETVRLGSARGGDKGIGSGRRESGEDGREVLAILWAGYHSAGSGQRVELPYTPPAEVKRPVEMWKKLV